MDQQNSGWKLDKTVNLPTLITIVSMVVTGTMAYASVKADAARANERLNSVEARQDFNARETAQQFSTLRAEMRADSISMASKFEKANSSMSDKIDQVIFRLGDTPRNLKEWTK